MEGVSTSIGSVQSVAASISNPTVMFVSVAPLWELSPNWVFCFLFAKSIGMIYIWKALDDLCFLYSVQKPGWMRNSRLQNIKLGTVSANPSLLFSFTEKIETHRD